MAQIPIGGLRQGVHQDFSSTGPSFIPTTTTLGTGGGMWSDMAAGFNAKFDPETAIGRRNLGYLGAAANFTDDMTRAVTNAKSMRQHARYLEAVTQYNLERDRIADAAQKGRMRASIGASGMDMNRGSPVARMVQEAYLLERDTYAKAHAGFQQARALKKQAKRELISGTTSSVTSLGTGLIRAGGGF